MAKAYLLLGGNIENREYFLTEAVNKIQDKIASIVKISQLYESEAWGFQSATNFLNLAIIIETNLLPKQLLHYTQNIEKEIGRTSKSIYCKKDKKIVYSSRVIDIDIIFYDNMVINDTNLIIPHLQMHKRRFVLEPMVELEPNFVHPIFKKTIKNILLNCNDKLSLRAFSHCLRSNNLNTTENLLVRY